MRYRVTCTGMLVLLLAFSFPLSAQSVPNETPQIGLDLGLGVHTFPAAGDTVESYQYLSLSPDLAFGKFGIGLDLTLHYRFTGSDNGNIQIRREDWYDSDFKKLLSLYMAKLNYVRYGYKGEPLFVKLGSIEDGLLGNGFILSGYSNMLRLPSTRVFGASFDLDGGLFNFPFIGIETFIGNLAVFDVIGARIYIRPLITTDIPIINKIQIGGTLAADRDPYYYAENPVEDTQASVVVLGLDYRLPLLNTPVITLANFGDIAFQNISAGGMLGFGGKLFGFVNYGAQIRILGDNFIPAYFDGTYDLYRPEKLSIYNGDVTLPGYFGWFISSGISLLGDNLAFNVSLDGPFGNPTADDSTVDTSTFNDPHLRASLTLADGVVPGISFTAAYDKKAISSFKELFSANHAAINARINYSTGPAVISLTYNLTYNPYNEGKHWDVTSGIESKIMLF